ncbi:MAG: CooT family nickel-binding protein [Oscillospiraceae bacterium]|nr:CooT family nickel-binding protein [Oscillospiraceae bacterium]
MCLATAMVNKSGTETVLAKNISKISIEGENIVMIDILGEEFVVEGTLISADLVNGVVKIQAA